MAHINSPSGYELSLINLRTFERARLPDDDN